jgi:hypothetical protein
MPEAEADDLTIAPIAQLLRRALDLIPRLVRDELLTLRLELVAKLKAAGVGIGLVVAAALFAFFFIVGLLAAAVLALSALLPSWLAALVVGAVLLAIAAVLTALGLLQLKQGVPPTPTDSIASIEADVRAVEGALQ